MTIQEWFAMPFCSYEQGTVLEKLGKLGNLGRGWSRGCNQDDINDLQFLTGICRGFVLASTSGMDAIDGDYERDVASVIDKEMARQIAEAKENKKL